MRHAAGMLGASCSSSEETARAVMIATVTGRDTGAVVVAHLLNAIPGYRIHGFAAGDGWVHLSEFAQRWHTLREKVTNRKHPEHIHFSQFHSSKHDAIAPEVDGSDFRSLPELVRRKIKPAWYQFFNASRVMCGMRRLVLDAYSPSRDRGFGFVHAFEDNGQRDLADPPARRDYSVAQALRSLDWFLHMFPLGKVVVHLPAAVLPDTTTPPRCTCPGTTTCRTQDSRWPDDRMHMMKALLRYHRSRPDRTLLTAANVDLRNLTELTMRMASFLGEQYSSTTRREAQRSFGGWANRLRRDEVLDLASYALPAARVRPEEEGCQAGRGVLGRCPPSVCRPQNASASRGDCTVCATTLADWAWRSADDLRRPGRDQHLTHHDRAAAGRRQHRRGREKT